MSDIPKGGLSDDLNDVATVENIRKKVHQGSLHSNDNILDTRIRELKMLTQKNKNRLYLSKNAFGHGLDDKKLTILAYKRQQQKKRTKLIPKRKIGTGNEIIWGDHFLSKEKDSKKDEDIRKSRYQRFTEDRKLVNDLGDLLYSTDQDNTDKASNHPRERHGDTENQKMSSGRDRDQLSHLIMSSSTLKSTKIKDRSNPLVSNLDDKRSELEIKKQILRLVNGYNVNTLGRPYPAYDSHSVVEELGKILENPIFYPNGDTGDLKTQQKLIRVFSEMMKLAESEYENKEKLEKLFSSF